MKILEEKYPLGSIPRQRTAGRYIDGTLYENLKVIAKTIVNDMTFLGIISSSTLEVGTGKTVFTQQVAEAYIGLVNQYHKLNLEFTMNNVVFRPKELIERAFKLPKYSVIILDEWDDLHYWSELGISLRQFFRKCRQLNLFIICIIPNFFQLPINYAISRSLFFVDVKFTGKFERGYFDFYSFTRKKTLYLKGKKTHNYQVIRPEFAGRFLDGYAVDEKVYKAAKYYDMVRSEEEVKKPSEEEVKHQLFVKVHKNLPEITVKMLSKGFGVHKNTGFRWLTEYKQQNA